MGMSAYMRGLRAKLGNQLLEVPSVSILLRDEAGRVLLVRDSATGVWTTPGGAIELLETPADAAVREMWEETGARVTLTRVVGVFGGKDFVVEYPNGDRTSYLMVVFEAHRIGGALRPDHTETSELRFFHNPEIESLEAPVWLPEVLAALRREDPGAIFRAPSWCPPGG